MQTEEIYTADKDFFDEIPWETIAFNVIEKPEYLRLKASYTKLYATFLGPEDSLSFFMFKPLSWPEYKDIKKRNLSKDDSNDYILQNCIVYPELDIIDLNELDAGFALTLIYQVMTVSNFLEKPELALDQIFKIQ